MTRIRQQNVTAAQWSSNGEALGAVDLALPENEAFGANVFSVEVQRERLPGDAFEKLQATLKDGEALDPRLADAVAEAMKDWGRADGGEPRLLRRAVGRRQDARRLLRQGADPGRA